MRRSLALLLLAAPAWSQATHEVPADFATIQAALDAAVAGDVVLVDPGVYREHLDFGGKDLILRSRFGPTHAILDGEHVDTVVDMSGGLTRNAVLDGFTIRRGNASLGGGVCAIESSPTILNCVFRENCAIDGGGIYLRGSGYVANCLFVDNLAGCYGSGIRVAHPIPNPPEPALVVHCTAMHNFSFDYFTGAAAISMGTQNGYVVNCISRDNENSGPLITKDIWSQDFGKVRHCNFRTGLTNGVNNLDEPPGFVAPNHGDFHLRATSACRDAGDPAFADPRDFEGDERDAQPDIGCDEHALHLYHLGKVKPGNTVRLRLIGATPGDTATIFTSVVLLDPPQMTGAGTLYLANPRSILASGLVVPANGLIELQWTVPPAVGMGPEGEVFPRATYLQAVTSELSNLEVAAFR